MKGHVIGFYDSGIGGLPYLRWMQERTENCSYRYLAETANFPFGTKSEDEIRHIVINSIGRFIEKASPDIIVIACNTASVTALELLRENYDIPFVGVVPAIKPAGILSRNKNIGLFATNKTVSQAYTQNLIDSFASGCTVKKFAMPEIVSFVEHSIFTASREEITRMITPATDFFKANGTDTIILGCTHFTYLEETFREIMGPGISIVDSREGVGKRTLSLLEGKKPSECSGENLFFTTSEEKKPENYRFIRDYFGLEPGGEI